MTIATPSACPKDPMPLSPRRALPAAAAVLGISMGLANLLSYVFVVFVSSALGPADFGGFSALNTYGVLLAMPAGAFQVVVAARQTDAARAAGRALTGVRSALLVGSGLAVVTIALAPVLRDVLRLDSAWSVVWLALMVPPMTVTGALQGVLLGRERYGRLSGIYLVTGGTRLVAAVLAVVAGLSVAQIFAATFVASVVSVLAALGLTRGLLSQGSGAEHPAALLAGLVKSNVALAGLTALSSLDVVLARARLDDHDSGAYALAALFGRVVFWGTQFLALTIVPTLADRRRATVVRSTLHRAALTVVVLGGLVALVCALVPGLLVRLTGGSAFADAEPLLVWCALCGTLWAVVQVWLFAEMSRGGHVLTVVVWVAAGVQALLVLTWLGDSPYEVVAAVGGTAGVVALIGLMLVPAKEPAPSPGSAETMEALDLTHD